MYYTYTYYTNSKTTCNIPGLFLAHSETTSAWDGTSGRQSSVAYERERKRFFFLARNHIFWPIVDIDLSHHYYTSTHLN